MIETIGINREKNAVATEIAELERAKARIEAQAPAEDVAKLSCDLIAGLSAATDQYASRAKINTQLKRFIFRITFDRDGLMRVLYGRDGKQLDPAPPGVFGNFFSQWPPEYRMRFTPSGVEREHPFFMLRPIAALRGNKMPADEFSEAWRHVRKRVRPTDTVDSYKNVLKPKYDEDR
jgi:hypothetical protein